MAQALLSGGSEPEPESAVGRVLHSEPSPEFSPERLAWSVEAYGGAAMANGEQLQLTSSQALRYGSVYENQRRRLGVFGSRDYDSSNLTRADRGAWTDEFGEPRLREPLPPGVTWTVKTDSDDTDADGWAYAFNFGDQWYDHERGKWTWVRRREWIVAPLTPAAAAVPAAWVDRLGPDVHLADDPADAATLVVEVRQARRVRTVGGDFAAAETDTGQAFAEDPSDSRLCARVTWHGQSFQTELSVHSGPNPIWFSADNSLHCRQCLSLPDKTLTNAGAMDWTSGVAEAELESPVAAVHVWTELWVNLRIDRIEFLYADGSTNKYGTPSGDQGSAGVVQEHCLVLDSILKEYITAVKTFSERTKTASGTKYVLSGLIFTTSLGRSWAVGQQNPPGASGAAGAMPRRTYEEGCLGVNANGQCISGLRVSQNTYTGLLASIDGITISNIFRPIDEAAVDLVQAQSGQASPWKISVPRAWSSGALTLSGDELKIELISPGRSTRFGAVPERSYGVVQIPGSKLLDTVGCDGWYILENSHLSASADEDVALGEVRIAWAFLATPVPSDLPLSAVPSPSALFTHHTKAARAAVCSSAVDAMGFKIQEHAVQSWMVGVSHRLCVEEEARRAWSNFDFRTATPQSTWRIVETHGVPAQFRLRVWPYIAGTDKLKIEADRVHSGRGTLYQSLCRRYEMVPDDEDPKAQIRKDLGRTFPCETTEVVACARAEPLAGEIIAALERLVGAYAMYNPRVGYCQSMNLVGGHLLLALACPGGTDWWVDRRSSEVEETAFWLLRHLAEEIVPHYWAQPSMSGMIHHTDVLDELCKALIPQTMTHFTDIPMPLVGIKWMAPLFGQSLPSATLYALWDRLLCKDGGGADVLLCAVLTILRGIDSDVLRHAPHAALQLSAASIHDAAPFINAVGSFHRKIKQYGGSIPRAPQATAHHFPDEIQDNPRCSVAWREMQLQATRSGWGFTEHQLMRLADAFLSAMMIRDSTSSAPAYVSLSECEVVVRRLLPGLDLVSTREVSASDSGGSLQAHATLASLLCAALSKCKPYGHTQGLTRSSSTMIEDGRVTLAQFGHGMHALHAGEASFPQRVALW